MAKKQIILKSGFYIFDKIEISNLRDSNIFIWDFDGVLHKKPYFLIVKLQNIISKKIIEQYGLIFNSEDYLVTGRGYSQNAKILNYLNIKGFTFKDSYFRPFFNKISSPFKIIEKYVNWKIEIFKEVQQIEGDNIVIIENNINVINKCIENNIKFLFFSIKLFL